MVDCFEFLKWMSSIQIAHHDAFPRCRRCLQVPQELHKSSKSSAHKSAHKSKCHSFYWSSSTMITPLQSRRQHSHYSSIAAAASAASCTSIASHKAVRSSSSVLSAFLC